MNFVGYFRNEKEARFQKAGPSFVDLKINEENFLNLCGDILDIEIQTSLLTFVQDFLKREKIDAILFFAGPSCTQYSQAQVGNIQRITANYTNFQKKTEKADFLVETTIKLFLQIETFAKAKHVPSFLFLENPWSRPFLKLEREEKIVLHPLGLRFRPFLQKYLKENSGFLEISYHCWCAYDASFPKKPSAVFSNLSLENHPCVCKSTKSDFVKHETDIQKLKNPHERAKWPKEFVEYVFQQVFETFEHKKQKSETNNEIAGTI